MRFRILCLCAAAAMAVPVAVATQQQAPAWNGVYSEAQARRGEPLYEENCLSCHGKDMTGTQKAPAVAGPRFTARWQSRPIRELFEYVQSTMPYNSPGGLSRAQNADIIALMLRHSQVPSGTRDFAPPQFGEEGSLARGLPFYTEEQAGRGKVAFDRYCGKCHTTEKSSQVSLEQMNKSGFPSSFYAPFLQRTWYGRELYPSAYYLYSKMQAMPAYDTHSVTQGMRADIIAHIMKANGFPSGAEELPPDPEAMKVMMLNEPGFERIFNGRDFTGIKFNVGPDCEPAPKGCGRTEPGRVVRVEGGKMVRLQHSQLLVHGEAVQDLAQ